MYTCAYLVHTKLCFVKCMVRHCQSKSTVRRESAPDTDTAKFPTRSIDRAANQLTNMASSIPPAMDRPVAITSRKDRTQRAPEHRRTIMTRGRGARCIPRNSSAVCLVGFFAALACLSSFALERIPLLSVPSGAAAAAAFFRLRTGILAVCLICTICEFVSFELCRSMCRFFVFFGRDGLSIARRRYFSWRTRSVIKLVQYSR